MHQTGINLAAKKTAAAAGSGPRTRLPFLRQVVQKAASMPTTAGTSSPYRRYPLLGPGETRQAVGSSVLYKDDSCVVVNDAFPKSTVHCLVMPLDTSLASLNDLRAEHVGLVRHLVEVARDYSAHLQRSEPAIHGRRRFLTGFHAIPSLPMLHMHLTSMDLASPCLKHKKHYNSFATYFFLTSDRIIEDLETHGRVTLNQDVATLRRMEEQPMKCLWCGQGLRTMPEVKAHIPQCPQNRSMS